MVLSEDGDHPMTKLSDTQAVILSAVSQRDDGAVLPLPETVKIKGGAVDKVLGSLKATGLIDHQGAPRGDNPPPLRITRAGLQAIGVETEDDARQRARRRATRARRQPMPEPRLPMCRSPGYRCRGPGDRSRPCGRAGELG
jgi:chromosome segregation and condensation protein ScpB